MQKTKISNWGKYPVIEAEVKSFEREGEVGRKTEAWGPWIPRGLGRCYGDSSLSPHVLSTLDFKRFLGFDPETGVLHCQSGVSFEEIINTFMPQGWFLPVTPGTKFITVGGAIAADIHGKNHHSEGSFSRHLHSLKLLSAEGEVFHCSRQENADIFWATCGGMGLTGLILEATFQLKKVESAYIVEESTKVKDLDTMVRLFEESMHHTYSVSWIDCLARGKNLGKGILLNGEHAKVSDLVKPARIKAPLALPKKGKLTMPPVFPSFTINSLTTKTFNKLFYWKAKNGNHRHIVDYDTYFYPLDGIHHWNRVYGKRGMAQYQFAIPPENGYECLKKVLEKISQRRMPSFLSVLKWFGKQEGMLSFPMEGYTLALDFPITKGLFPFLDELDAIVLDYGGRLYLTKDSRMKPEMLQKGYPRLQEFLEIKKRLDPHNRMASLQSQRLGL